VVADVQDPPGGVDEDGAHQGVGPAGAAGGRVQGGPHDRPLGVAAGLALRVHRAVLSRVGTGAQDNGDAAGTRRRGGASVRARHEGR
jgi:hypothetical protein